jgi:AraC family transcriptional regulator, transcriptional activator of pobA
MKQLNSVEDYNTYFGFPSAGHPLIAINRLAGMNYTLPDVNTAQLNLYAIVFKKGSTCTSTYGWRSYDFTKGLMNFFAPGQIMHWGGPDDVSESSGWLLVFHPDFIRRYPLGTNIGKYKFFSYDVNEALHMSDAERLIIEGMLENVQRECNNNIDEQSHDIIVSQIDLILNYGERFYKRQFRTRFSVDNNVVSRFQAILQKQDRLLSAGDIASEMAMSTHYLAEMLRNLTGMNTQQHIHAYIIEKAKALLVNTELSVSEIAYRLGFEYPQYFNRLFKNKTGHTPVEFRSRN